MSYTLEKTIDLAIQAAVQKAKKEAILECRPVGSYFLTETEDDPNILFGGEWQKLTGRYVLQCSDANHKAGTTVEAGLPNIEGTIAIDLPGGIPPFENGGYGALFNNYSGKSYTPHIGGGASITRSSDNYLRFDASRSNPIYGRSDTVQPPARIVNVWKRVS